MSVTIGCVDAVTDPFGGNPAGVCLLDAGDRDGPVADLRCGRARNT